jgi:hypothetical protein
MRPVIAALALACAVAAPAAAQTAPGEAACAARQTNLGGIGRAGVIAFTGPISGAAACATFANVASDGFDAHVGDAAAPDALVAATTGTGGDVTVPLRDMALSGVGPYVVAPGGGFPPSNGDVGEAPRIVLAFAGPRVLLIATTPVELVDLTRVLRDRPDLFGADAVERAVVIAAGPQAALSLRTDSGTIGASAVVATSVLSLVKRR